MRKLVSLRFNRKPKIPNNQNKSTRSRSKLVGPIKRAHIFPREIGKNGESTGKRIARQLSYANKRRADRLIAGKENHVRSGTIRLQTGRGVADRSRI